MRIRTGPPTDASTVFESARPSAVHTAPAAPQSRPPASVTATSRHEPGFTCTRHTPPPRSSTSFTLPARVSNDAAVGPVPPAPSASLKRTSSASAASPSCSSGTFSNDAVKGCGAAGRSTRTA